MYFRAEGQFTVAPPQHRLYFLPEPQGHGSFRPNLGAVRRSPEVRHLPGLRLRREVNDKARNGQAAMCAITSS
jgi:hypothetical protein